MNSDRVQADRELREQIERSTAFLRRALRFWPSVPLVLALGAVACAVFFVVRKPTYRSETVVLYSQPASAPGESSEQMGGARNVTVRMKELLMSRPKLERVVGEFGLYPDVRSDLGMGEAVEELKKHIEYRAPGGDTFSIAFLGRSPDEVQGVTKRLAALVIEQDSELRKNQARVTRDFLVAEKAKTEATLRSAERELAAFMALHPRFALDVTPLATGAAIRATTPAVVPGAQPAPARMTVFVPKRVSPGGAAPAAGSPRTMVPTTVDADSEIARANAAVAAARTHLAEQLERYTPAHPDVRSATAAVKRAESRLSTLAAAAPPAAAPAVPAPTASPSTEASPVAPAAAAPQRVASAPAPPVAPASQPAGSAGDVVALETDWLKLTRAATEARQRYDQVSAALFKADIVASSESGGRGLQMTVIDPAYLPTRPQPPGRLLIAAVILGAALALGVALALIRAVLDDRIFEARDAGGPAELLVAIPRSGSIRRAHVPS
jgi:capsular polysaccharide biosynthesis protein